MDNYFDWQAGVVAIIGRESKPAGAGFVVSPDGLILTCAHVLSGAGWSYKAWSEPVQVRFEAIGRFALAHVQEDCFSDLTDGDFALLRLENSLPNDVAILNLGPAAGSEGHEVRFRGYPADHPGVMGGDGRVLALVTTRNSRQQLQLKSAEATHGYSGGPVWDPARRRAIGLFQSGRTEPDEIGRLGYAAFAIPAETLAAACTERLFLQPVEELHPVSSDTKLILDHLDQSRKPRPAVLTTAIHPEQGLMAKKEPIRVDRAKLLNAMTNAFNESELQKLCFELDIDYEDLKPGGKSDKARELILYCQRHNRLDDLLVLCQQKRPHIGWAAVRQPSTVPAGDPGPVVRQEPADIFLSYSRKDSDIKDRLAQDLRQAGLSVWTDDGLEPGTPSWEQAIQNQLETAGCLVVLLSPDAKQSLWVGKELSYGAVQGKRIFPAMIRGTRANAIPITIINAQFVDLRQEYGSNFARLRDALKRHLGRAPAEPEPAPAGSAAVQTPPKKPVPRPPRVEPVAGRRSTDLAAPPDGVTIPHIVTGAPPLDIDWCWVPAGPFTMGRDRDPTALSIPIFKSDEEPAHIVDLEGFWLARYPVTNAQFRHFIEAGGYEDASWWSDAGWQWRHTWSVKQPKSWTKSKWNGDRQPVVGVSWYEANAFTRWAAETTGEPIRLPTEAAWEKAARGTDGRTYPWGNDQPTTKLSKFGRKVGNPPVGQYSPAGDGPYGNADLVSNVREWTSSLYKSYPYAADDGREDQAARDRRVIRGRDPRAHGPTSASFRWQSRPIDYDHEDGFRVACRSPSP